MRRVGRRRLGGYGPYYIPQGQSALYVPRVTNKRKTPSGPSAPIRTGRRVRPKLVAPGSRTITKTKFRRRRANARKIGDNSSLSWNRIGGWRMSKFMYNISRSVQSPQVIYLNGTGKLSSTTGKQQANSFLWLGQTELTAMETAANGGVATSVPVKFFLKSMKSVLKVKNNTSCVAKVTIYDIVVKKIPPSTIPTPESAWAKGLADYGATYTTNTVGFTPFRSPEFNMYYGVNKTTSVLLEPGQQHDHTVYRKYNKLIDSVRFQNASGTVLPGLSWFSMVVFHGSLCHDAVDATKVSYAPVSLDCAWNKEYAYGWLEKTAKTVSITDNVGSVVVTTPNALGEGNDVDANIFNA